MKKKILALLMTSVLALSLTACGSQGNASTSGSKSPSSAGLSQPAGDQIYTIGICQLAPHPALDSASQGFRDKLTEKLGSQVKFIEGNAGGEANNCIPIVDGFIAEGTESGGHVGELTTMALVPQVCACTSLPVIAAGGIASGPQLAAAFALGACGAQVGTCLLVSEECPIHDNYKQAVLKAKDSDTTVTGRSVNAPVRILKNQMSREYLKLERAGAERMELEKFTLGSLRRAVFDGDVKTGSLMCGQNAGLLHEIRHLRTILEELCSGCRDTVRRLAEEV